MKIKKKPEWLKVPPPWGKEFTETNKVLKKHGLQTVCRNANCPNIGECYRSGTATFLIMGHTCTRGCTFCNIQSAKPAPLDKNEPIKVARAVKQMGLSYAVVTSVTRDDLPNGGSSHFAKTIRQIKRLNPDCKVEVLVPDFKGNLESIREVVEQNPAVFNHNVETVPRLYEDLRPQADYERSLQVLKTANSLNSRIPTKSGIMVGGGETAEEIYKVFEDLNKAGIKILTIGQYLPPSSNHHPLDRYYTPKEFEQLGLKAREAGIPQVISAPLVRSSYNASELFMALEV